jgi:type IX secretion system PorP/SprF family membrane protein
MRLKIINLSDVLSIYFPKIILVSYCQLFMSKRILFIYVFILSFSATAQQEAIRMVYPFIPMALNPAEAGANGVISVTGIFRKKPLIQQFGMSSSSQQYFSFDKPVKNDAWGMGFLAYNTDQAYAMPLGGIASNLGLAGILAKAISLGRGSDLRVGGQIGINQYPVIGRSGTSELTGSYGWGFLYKQDEFTLAFSQPAAQMQEMNWRSSSPMYIKGQYIFKTKSGNAIKSGSVVRFIQGLDTQIDLYSVFWWQERLGFGLWWQNTGSELGNPALIGSIEVPLGKNFKVGYGYDFLGENVSTLPAGISGSANATTSTTASGFHQIFLRYELDTGNGKLAEFRH